MKNLHHEISIALNNDLYMLVKNQHACFDRLRIMVRFSSEVTTHLMNLWQFEADITTARESVSSMMRGPLMLSFPLSGGWTLNSGGTVWVNRIIH
jgi:hypothetical protein